MVDNQDHDSSTESLPYTSDHHQSLLSVLDEEKLPSEPVYNYGSGSGSDGEKTTEMDKE